MNKLIFSIMIFCSLSSVYAQKCKDVNVNFPIQTGGKIEFGNKNSKYSSNTTYLNIPNSIDFSGIGKISFQATRPSWSPSENLKLQVINFKTYEYSALESDFFVEVDIESIKVLGREISAKSSMSLVSSELYIIVSGNYLVRKNGNDKNGVKISFEGGAPLKGLEFTEGKTLNEVHAKFADQLDFGKKVNTLNYDEAIISAMRMAEFNAFMPGFEVVDRMKFNFLKDFPDLDFDKYKKMAKDIQDAGDKSRGCISIKTKNSPTGGFSLGKLEEMANSMKPLEMCTGNSEFFQGFKQFEPIFLQYLQDYYKYTNHSNTDVKTAVNTNAFNAYVYFLKYDSAIIISKDLGDHTEKWYIKNVVDKLNKYKNDVSKLSNFDPTQDFENQNLSKIRDREAQIVRIQEQKAKETIDNKFIDGSFKDKKGNTYTGKIYYNPYTIKFKGQQYSDIRHNVMYFICAEGADCKEFKSSDNTPMPISAALIDEMTINGTKYLSKDVLVKGLLKSYRNYLFTIKENDQFGIYERYPNEDASKVEYVYWIKSKENPIAEDISKEKLIEYFSNYPKVIESIKSNKTAKEISELMF